MYSMSTQLSAINHETVSYQFLESIFRPCLLLLHMLYLQLKPMVQNVCIDIVTVDSHSWRDVGINNWLISVG